MSADAGILYTLTFNLNNGHTFIPVEKLLYAVCMLLSDDDVVVDEDRALHGIARLEEKGRLVREHIADRDAVYLRDMHDVRPTLPKCSATWQSAIMSTILMWMSCFPRFWKAVSSLFLRASSSLRISTAARNGLVILTGGPGT